MPIKANEALTFNQALLCVDTGASVYDDYGLAYRVDNIEKGEGTWCIFVTCLSNGLQRHWVRAFNESLSWLSMYPPVSN
jgi:hypothetical protein